MHLHEDKRGLIATVPRELLDQWAKYFAENFDLAVRPSEEQVAQAVKAAVINVLAFSGLENQAEIVDKDLTEVRLLLSRHAK